MTNTARIVVGVDGSDGAKAALRWAIRQARLIGAEVLAVSAWEYPASYGWAPMYPDDPGLAELTAKMLADTVAQVRGDATEPPISTQVVEGPAAQALLAAAAGADLLVVGSRGRGGFTGLLLGSVSQQCVSHGPCPVVVIPRQPTD